MDSFEWNKIFGGILASILAVLLIQQASILFFQKEELEELAYAVELPDAAGTDVAAVEEEVVEEVPFDPAVIFASVDPAAGEAFMGRQCQACHNWSNGGNNGVGPNLWGVVGADIARKEGYRYSSAMGGWEGDWTPEALYKFLEAPKEWMPGTKMGYGGMRKSEDRANVIAFLNQQSDTPIDLQ